MYINDEHNKKVQFQNTFRIQVTKDYENYTAVQ